MRFNDRRDAGRRLAGHLREAGVAPAVVLGVARGGIAVAREVAAELGSELGTVVVAKLAAPWNPEFALGAVAAGVPPWIDHARAHELGVSIDHLDREIERQQRECARREADFARFGVPAVEGRDVLVVDDALSSGATALVALRRARSLRPSSLGFAAPVAAPAAAAALHAEITAVHLLSIEPRYSWAGSFYEDFGEVDEETVCRILARARDARPIGLRRLAVRRDGIELAAVLELPEGEGPFPAVVCLHDAGEDSDSAGLLSLAQRLRVEGFATLRFDRSGEGRSGASAQPAPARFIADLGAAFAAALQAPELDRHRIAIAGDGLGAWVALRATVDGVVGPAALALRAPPILREDLLGLAVPCLLVSGGEDANLRGAVAAAGRDLQARLEIVPGAGPRFSEPGAREIADRLVVRWLSERLLAKRTAAG